MLRRTLTPALFRRREREQGGDRFYSLAHLWERAGVRVHPLRIGPAMTVNSVIPDSIRDP